MKATGIFTVLSVPLLLVLPLRWPWLMNQKFRGRNLFRAVYFAPYVLGVAVVAVLWRYLLDSNIGLVNHYLGVLGLPYDIAWLTVDPGPGSPWSASPCGGRSGFNAIIYLAGLQDISPRALRGRTDGRRQRAGSGSGTSRCPGCGRCSLFVTSVTIIASANMFGQSYLMTQGASGHRDPHRPSTRSPRRACATSRWATRPR